MHPHEDLGFRRIRPVVEYEGRREQDLQVDCVPLHEGETKIDVVERGLYRTVGALRSVDEDAHAGSVLVGSAAPLADPAYLGKHALADIVAVDIDTKRLSRPADRDLAAPNRNKSAAVFIFFLHSYLFSPHF